MDFSPLRDVSANIALLIGFLAVVATGGFLIYSCNENTAKCKVSCESDPCCVKACSSNNSDVDQCVRKRSPIIQVGEKPTKD